MTDNDALHIVRNPYGFNDIHVSEARLYLCDRFEEVKRELDQLHESKFKLCLDLDKAENERDNAQRIASLTLDVENWLFRTVDALTDNPPHELSERTQSGLMDVWTDMNNARENRKAGG